MNRRNGSVDRRSGFSDVGYEEAARRAHAVVPKLRELAGAQEQARQLTPEVLALLHENGLLRFLQPKRWGGMELDYVSVFDLPEIIGRGDASTAWNVGNLSIHHWMLALYDPKAQEEVWADDPDAIIASGIAYPQGRARARSTAVSCCRATGISPPVSIRRPGTCSPAS